MSGMNAPLHVQRLDNASMTHPPTSATRPASDLQHRKWPVFEGENGQSSLNLRVYGRDDACIIPELSKRAYQVSFKSKVEIKSGQPDIDNP